MVKVEIVGESQSDQEFHNSVEDLIIDQKLKKTHCLPLRFREK